VTAPGGGRWQTIFEKSLDCVHCGLCLESCPTYRETGREISSPRGRVYLMRGVAEGRIPLGDAVAEEAYLCLGCRACETACPSGVEYGAMLELTRAEVEDARLRRGFAKTLERLALRHVVPHPRRLRLLVDLLSLAQTLRLDRLALALAPRSLRELADLLPAAPARSARRSLPERVPARGERRGRVGFFVGCLMPELFGATNRDTVDVLAHNGFDVVIPREQGCCGALHAHAGDEAFAHALARRNAAAFARAGVSEVVVNSAGCGAALRDAARWLGAEGEAIAAGAIDVSSFLQREGLRPVAGRFDARVCYDDPCHLVHAQKVSAAPRQLLEQIPGLALVAHDDPGSCCGAAGIYNLTHREMSRAVLARKLQALAAADPDVIATGNPGCLMQLRSGVARAGLRAEVLHPVEILARAYFSSGVSRPSRRIL
jgi:glycolate oxidase iron-sulfur subunit